jgi:Xaa-Pro dipeptidase
MSKVPAGFDRRRFLAGAGLATAGAFIPEVHAASIASDPEMPAPIAALKSRKHEAKPITAAERQQRIERARELMTEQKMDALLVCGGTTLEYFAGIKWWLSERFFAMILPAKGAPFFVCPAFEEDRAREQVAKGPFGGSKADVRTWEEHENPHERVREGLSDRGLSTGTIGIEEYTYYTYADRLAKTALQLKLVLGTPVTAGCRMIKSQHELALMKLASEVTWSAYKAAWQSLKPGMTQNDFAGFVARAHERQGFQGGAGVQVGEYSALPHGSIQPQVVKEGTILLVDGVGDVEGYKSDISRTFVLGKATDKMKRVFEIEQRAQKAALAAAKPGVPCEAVDAAARKVIVEAGYGPDYKYFTHRVGHGMGMDVHEWPYLVRGNKLPLQPGMTFSDEPGIYIRGEFGVRLEDDMVITENGAILTTPTSPSLEDPFGTA